MSCPVAGAGYGHPTGGAQAAAFVLVLFILLVIILKAGWC
ncbi:sporulation protein YjcZ [Cohnella mopanensis]|nr:sporulation protein YjcZ [Cohnella mopanensis]